MNEFLAHFSRALPETRKSAASFVRLMLADSKYQVEFIGKELFSQALELFENRPDKRYSMVDCVGMTMMRSHDIQEVLTTDRDFEQEGFVNLMRQHL